jgi:hypothetical protein
MAHKCAGASALAPVVLFVFKRIESTKRLIDSVLQNTEAADTELFIFSDGPKNESDAEIVAKVREYIYSIKGFKSVNITCSPVNKGLANSIINGVTAVLDTYSKVIVLEDDLFVSGNFLQFMNQELEYYDNNDQVMSIAGYTLPIISRPGDDVYFTKRACSEGWATWVDKWREVDWEVRDFDSFTRSKSAQTTFNKMGSDLTQLLNKQMKQKVDSWAIRWCYHQFKKELYTVYPTISKVRIFGMDNVGTHNSQKWDRFKTVLDESESVQFNFKPEVQLDRYYIKQFVSRHSIQKRVSYKILDYIKSARILSSN